MSRIALLDVNFLVALFDPDHVHHDIAHDWFAEHRTGGWATCPLTENGFIRVVTNPAYAADVRRPDEAIARLGQFCASGDHVFWTESLSLRDRTIFSASFIRGHRQLTDVYLLGLAVSMGGHLATFDRTIPLGAVVKATRRNLTFVAPAPEG